MPISDSQTVMQLRGPNPPARLGPERLDRPLLLVQVIRTLNDQSDTLRGGGERCPLRPANAIE